METGVIISYSLTAKQNEANEFEEAFYDSLCQYSLRDLQFVEGISHERIEEALATEAIVVEEETVATEAIVTDEENLATSN